MSISTSDASAIHFKFTIATGGQNLTLNAGAMGNINLDGALSGGGAFTVTNGAAVNLAAITAASILVSNVQTSLDFNGAISLSGNLTVTTTASGAPITLHSTATAANTSMTGGGTLTTNAGATLTTTPGTGTVVLNAGNTLTINGSIDPSTVDLDHHRRHHCEPGGYQAPPRRSPGRSGTISNARGT